MMHDLDMIESDTWLADLARAAGLCTNEDEYRQDFEARTLEAARLALATTQLRRDRARQHFTPHSFRHCVQELARRAGAPVDRVYALLGGAKYERLDTSLVSMLAGLARRLGMSLNEALLVLRLEYAFDKSLEHRLVLAYGYGGSPRWLDSVSDVLRRHEAEYSATEEQSLRTLMHEFAFEFSRERQASP